MTDASPAAGGECPTGQHTAAQRRSSEAYRLPPRCAQIIGDVVVGDALPREGRLIALEGSPVLSSRSYCLMVSRRQGGALARPVVRWLKAGAAAFARDQGGRG